MLLVILKRTMPIIRRCRLSSPDGIRAEPHPMAASGPYFTLHHILNLEWRVFLIKYILIIMIDLLYFNQSGATELLLMRDSHNGRMCFKSVKILGVLHSSPFLLNRLVNIFHTDFQGLIPCSIKTLTVSLIYFIMIFKVQFRAL